MNDLPYIDDDQSVDAVDVLDRYRDMSGVRIFIFFIRVGLNFGPRRYSRLACNQ